MPFRNWALIDDILLSPVFQHRVYIELTTHNLTLAAKHDTASSENNWLISCGHADHSHELRCYNICLPSRYCCVVISLGEVLKSEHVENLNV